MFSRILNNLATGSVSTNPQNSPRRLRRALRELEMLPVRDLEDMGLTRAELVARVFGTAAGQCADF